MKRILSLLAASALLLSLCPAGFASEDTLFWEDFEEQGFVSDDPNGESAWYSNSSGFLEDSDIFHDGSKSLAIKDGSPVIEYRGDKICGNYVYEFWYYDDGNDGTGIVDFVGTKQDGTYVEDKALFGVKNGAYTGRYIVGNYSGSDAARYKGWHQVIADFTVNGKLTMYLDGEIASRGVNNASTDVYNVTGIKFRNQWYKGKGFKFNLDSIKAYNTMDEVPVYRKTVISELKFESGIDAENAEDIVTADGNIKISFSENINPLDGGNFTLLKRPADSVSDKEYVPAAVTLVASDETSAELSIDNMEADTTYRLGFSGIETQSGKIIASDFILFSTYDNLDWNKDTPKGLVYSEDFEDDLADWNVTDPQFTKLSDSIYHTGKKSLSIDNMSGNTGAAYAGETPLGNFIYAFWFYDSKVNDGKTLADLTGIDASGNAVKEKSMFGVKIGSWGTQYIGADTNTTKVERTPGWHYVVMDASKKGSLSIYLDGKVTNINNYTANQPAEITGIRFFNAWNRHGAVFNFDGLQVYKKLEDVPVYKTELLDSVKFDDGTQADNAEGVIEVNGNLNVNYKEAMKAASAENFELLSRDVSSESDADFAAESFSIISSDDSGVIISIDELKPSSEYRLVMKNLESAGGKVMADDFIEFKTAENIELEQSVVAKTAFDNGTVLPSVGIPETFGDLVIHFAMEMDTATLNSDSIILAKEDGTVIDYVANASEKTYTINSASIGMEPQTTYLLTVNQGAKTKTGNYAISDYTVSFTTSKDLAHQEAILDESFENGTDNWIMNGQMYLDTNAENAHSGNNSIRAVNGSVAYKGTVPANAVYEMWMYDTGNAADAMAFSLSGKNTAGEVKSVQIGAKNGYGAQYFLMRDFGNGITVGKRSPGWHRFLIDFRNPDAVNYYIDDELIITRAEEIRQITGIAVSNPWQWPTIYVDDIKIWNTLDYDVISRIEESRAFICDSDYNRIVDYKAGSNVYIAVNVNNQQPKVQSTVLAVGEYKNGALSRVLVGEKTNILMGESVNLRVPYIIPENFEEYELKAFCWESMETMKPVMPASDPKDITAVFLGGSITAGAMASSNDKCYVSLVGEYLKENYGGENSVEIVNSGVGGKGSAFGAEYFDTYVKAYAPDILFIEYAVNDRKEAGGNEADVKKNMEKIVQKALDLPKVPNIVFIYTTTYKLEACTDWHQAVADYYEIPVIDLQEALKNKVESDILEDASLEEGWKSNGAPYLEDGVHPSDLGYAFYAEQIIKSLAGGDFFKAPKDMEAIF